MDSWRYEPTEDFGQGPLDRLRNFPRHPDLAVYGLRSAANLLMRGILATCHRLRIEGRENLPSSGSFVMVANHASHLDTPVLLAALPVRSMHRAFPAAASDYFFTSIPKLAFSAIVVNALPFDRKDDPNQSLAICRRLLETPGHILILFPEGTRTLDGTIGRFKRGVGFLTAGTEFPVVPCCIHGAFQAWRKGAWMPKPWRLRLTIGRPMLFSDARPTKEDAVAIADRLREAVVSLSHS